MSIVQMSHRLRDLIAAGEVVQRPANVLKELLENAIDAGASRVEIRAVEGGVSLLEVADDGAGISSEDLPLAAENHATSKISVEDDLQAIVTLGFRGEALASVRACSELQISSRTADADQGRLLNCHPDGSMDPLRPVGRDRGTTVTVQDLFGNLPARRKFLKSARTEQGRLREIVVRVLLAWPEMALRYEHNGKVIFDEPAGSRMSRVLNWMNKEDRAHPIEIVEDGPLFSVHFIGAQPASTSTRADSLLLFVNGRPVQDRSIIHGITEGYNRWIPHGRYPRGVCFLTVDPAWIDVNVHPSKTEIRFTDPRLIHDFLVKTVRRSMEQHAGLPVVPPVTGSERSRGSYESTEPRGHQGASGGGAPPFMTRSYGGTGKSGMESLQFGPHKTDPDGIPLTAEFADGYQSGVRIMGQIMAKYIVAEVKGSLWVIDQHAAHEALNYERIRRAVLCGESGQTQMLLVPQELQVSEEAAEQLAANSEAWRSLGYDLRIDDSGAIQILGVPDWSDVDNEVFLADWAEQLGMGQTPVEEQQPLVVWAAQRACKASVRANTHLGIVAMQKLIEQLIALPEGAACPHGRPTRVFWTEKDLDRLIQREGHD